MRLESYNHDYITMLHTQSMQLYMDGWMIPEHSKGHVPTKLLVSQNNDICFVSSDYTRIIIP